MLFTLKVTRARVLMYIQLWKLGCGDSRFFYKNIIEQSFFLFNERKYTICFSDVFGFNSFEQLNNTKLNPNWHAQHDGVRTIITKKRYTQNSFKIHF